MLKKLHALTLGLLTYSFLSVAQASPESDAILERMFEAYGGKERITKDSSLYQTGVISSRARGVSGPAKRIFQYPDQMRVEIKYPDNTEIRILNGDKAINNGAPAHPAAHAAAQLQAARLMLPRLLLENKDKLKSGPADAPERALYELTMKNGLIIRAEIDSKTGYIMHSEGTGHVSGTPLAFATDYEDFRNVEGRTVAFREKNFAMGNPIGSTLLDGVDFNLTLPADTFE